VNTLSIRTLGHVVAAADLGPAVLSKAKVRSLLMLAGLYDLPGFDTTRTTNRYSS
jgi:hypothetical protein